MAKQKQTVIEKASTIVFNSKKALTTIEISKRINNDMNYETVSRALRVLRREGVIFSEAFFNQKSKRIEALWFHC